MQAPTRRVPLHSTCNTRDLGGYPTRDGRVTRFGRLYRSDLPHGMTGRWQGGSALSA